MTDDRTVRALALVAALIDGADARLITAGASVAGRATIRYGKRNRA